MNENVLNFLFLGELLFVAFPFNEITITVGVLGLRHLKYVQDFLMCFDIFQVLHLLEVMHTLINLHTVSLTTNMSYLSYVSYISYVPDISYTLHAF